MDFHLSIFKISTIVHYLHRINFLMFEIHLNLSFLLINNRRILKILYNLVLLLAKFIRFLRFQIQKFQIMIFEVDLFGKIVFLHGNILFRLLIRDA